MLLTWASVAYGNGCAAPWLANGDAFADDAAVFAGRATWLSTGGAGDAALGRVAAAVTALGEVGLRGCALTIARAALAAAR